MAAVLEPFIGMDEDTARTQQLANARKKLKSFRATRSSDHNTASSSSSSFAPFPLTTDATFNISTSTVLPPLDHEVSKAFDLPPLPERPPSPGKLRKSRSKGSMSHRRQNSSISGNGLTRGSVVGLFDTDQLDLKPMRAEVPRLPACEFKTALTTPLLDAPSMNNMTPPEDQAAVKSRLTAFSFGSKPPPNARSPSPRARRGQPLLPSQLHSAESSPSPETSPLKRNSLSTPLSRPPSLLLTRPTPLACGSPAPAGQARQLEPPSTPPTPARTKRHSHTRSNSISLPNLKLTSRPTSLGIPNSPSFPSSPSSPANLSRPNSIQGTRLKFEPSGRGAEAEKEKEEYRRKALEKLTGSPTPSPLLPESPGQEIALPDLDDEDGSSVASSARPFSGFGSFNFGRPSSSSSTPPGMSWSNNEDSPPLERWSTSFNVKSEEQDEMLGFGFTFAGNGSGSFSFGAAPPAYPSVEASIGLGLPSTLPARPSLTRNLSVLAEVDEPEDGEYDGASDPFTTSPEIPSVPFSPTADELDIATDAHRAPVVAPTPSRLRELHLVSTSSAVSGPPRPPASNTPSRSNSPTKGYGSIGRGRPAPITVHTNIDSPSVLTATTTPKSAGGPRRRPGPGSRGSSISYRKECESSSSSRDWSMSSKAPFSPPTSLSELTSPPAQPAFAPSFGGWSNLPRSGPVRPCPRPKSLAGLGFDNQGAGRVLGELEEVEEDGHSLRKPSTRVASDDAPNSAGLSDILHESFGAGGVGYEWQTSLLELEMERDALQEDVDLWRKRCNGLEERLELEKKENGILRERVRKLGDRLSSIVSYPATRSDTSLVADLRTQLFGVKAELERERNEKLSACERVADLEAKLASMKITPVSTPAPVVTNLIPPAPVSPNPEDDQNAISDSASPGMDPSLSPDPSTQRMRAWGFPREAIRANQPRNRESFFGLSQLLRPGSSEEERDDALGGIDLPPIDFMTAEVYPSTTRAVSDPTPVTSRHPDQTEKAPPRISLDSAQRSTSLTSSASSALSFFTGYLPGRTKSPPLAAQSGSFAALRMDQHVVKRLPTSEDKGIVDLRGGCKCCTGDVIEL